MDNTLWLKRGDGLARRVMKGNEKVRYATAVISNSFLNTETFFTWNHYVAGDHSFLLLQNNRDFTTIKERRNLQSIDFPFAVTFCRAFMFSLVFCMQEDIIVVQFFF